MEVLTSDVNWVVVVVGAVVSFILGSLWYAPFLFGNKWRQGLGTPAVPGRAMGPLLFVEAVACFLLAWLIVLLAGSSLTLAIFAAIVIAGAIKSNDLFSGKSMYATAVESGYILAKVAVIIATYQILN